LTADEETEGSEPKQALPEFNIRKPRTTLLARTKTNLLLFSAGQDDRKKFDGTDSLDKKMQRMIHKSLKWRTCSKGKMFDEEKLICVVKQAKILVGPYRRGTSIYKEQLSACS
jgi:hypothetical protein